MNGKGYKLKAIARDVHYTYQGYPHEDEEIEISVWNGDNQVPIGEVAKVAYSAGENERDRQKALSEKYGSDFAEKFFPALDDGLSQDFEETECVVEESAIVYSRLSCCSPAVTEESLQRLRRLGVEVEDLRSEESRALSAGLLKLLEFESEEIVEKLTDEETCGRLTKAQTIQKLVELYGVNETSAELYADTYCEYEYVGEK